MKRQVAFTLRFDPTFYERIKSVSASEGRSVTSFVQEAVARKLDEEAAASLFQAFIFWEKIWRKVTLPIVS